MKLAAADLLSNYGGEIREAYSGRGMYGKETTGIIFGTERDFFNALSEAFEEVISDNSLNEGDELTQMLKKLQSDNMGTSIIYY